MKISKAKAMPKLPGPNYPRVTEVQGVKEPAQPVPQDPNPVRMRYSMAGGSPPEALLDVK